MRFTKQICKQSLSFNSIAVTCLAAFFTLSSGVSLAGPPSHAKGNPPPHTGGPPPDAPKKPLLIEEHGSFFVGGEAFFSELANSTNPDDSRNPGTATINQTYVEFLIPAKKRFKYPIIMMPGGGHEQKVYETTPDGREGWATYFPRNGMSTYLSDGVNRGASSWDLTNVVLVAQGELPFTEIPSMNRYSHELAWTQFRIGPEFGVQHPGGQFPVEAFEQYTNQLVPAFRDPIEDDKNVAALVAVIDEVGPTVLLVWSQSGRFGIRAALQRPDLVKGIVMIEPFFGSGGLTALISDEQIAALSDIPILDVDGDFRARSNNAEILGDNATSLWLPGDVGIFGNSHVMMLERNNLEIADLILDWIKENVK